MSDLWFDAFQTILFFQTRFTERSKVLCKNAWPRHYPKGSAVSKIGSYFLEDCLEFFFISNEWWPTFDCVDLENPNFEFSINFSKNTDFKLSNEVQYVSVRCLSRLLFHFWWRIFFFQNPWFCKKIICQMAFYFDPWKFLCQLREKFIQYPILKLQSMVNCTSKE